MASWKGKTSVNYVRAIATVKKSVGDVVSDIASGGIDHIADLFGKTLLLELVSENFDPGKFSY